MVPLVVRASTFTGFCVLSFIIVLPAHAFDGRSVEHSYAADVPRASNDAYQDTRAAACKAGCLTPAQKSHMAQPNEQYADHIVSRAHAKARTAAEPRWVRDIAAHTQIKCTAGCYAGVQVHRAEPPTPASRTPLGHEEIIWQQKMPIGPKRSRFSPIRPANGRVQKRN